MRTQCLRYAACDLLHCRFGALESVDREWEVEGLLDLPDALMLSWWQYLCGVSDGDPTNGNGCALGDMGLEVYDPIDSNFAAFAQASRMKDRCACGDEYFIFDGTTHHMSVRPNEAIVPDGQRVTPALRRTAFSMTMHSLPMETAPPSAMTCAPYMMRQPGPIVTLPHTTAFGATQAVGSICGETPACLMSKWFSLDGLESA